MRVFVVYDDPRVQVASNNDPIVLDLVAHFLGMVSHDNEDRAPSVIATPVEPGSRSRKGSHVLAFQSRRQDVAWTLDQEACARATDETVRRLRFSHTSKSQVSLRSGELHCPIG